MNYWVVSPNVKNNNEADRWKEFVSTNPYSFLAWEGGQYAKKFTDSIKKGDVIITAQRQQWNAYVFGIGIVKTDECTWQQIEGAPSDAHCRELYPYLTKESISEIKLDFKGTTYHGNNKQIPSIYRLHPEKNENDKRLVSLIENELNIILQMQTHLNLLESNKNLVLTGAPGTGKTYLAKAIAKAMIGDGDENTQMAFVQFHPSYDYTDFVEGLRPIKKDDTLGFELKNGIFKAFCKKAKDAPDSKFVFIIDEINRGEISKIFGELFFSIDPGYRGEDGKVKTQYHNIQTEQTCFISLENDDFYVPENVYIIGTMNDIDRSVENFDFAMRRRFAWKEVSAKESQIMLENKDFKDKAIARMDALNTAIDKIDGLGAAFHIGAAYFLKLELAHCENDFDKLWTLHIGTLLSEYLRGVLNAKENLETLKKAYDGE